MAQIVWGENDRRSYEYGIDRGVLYLPNDKRDYVKAYAWDGLTSVDVESSSKEVKSFYQDGVKYNLLAIPRDFEGTLKAYTYPDEFQEYENFESMGAGFYGGNQQSTNLFALSYRSWRGTAAKGNQASYKIHLLYNLTATPGGRENQTTNKDLDIMDFSWSLTGVPVAFPGLRPTCHLVLDTRFADKKLVKTVEDILYGGESQDGAMPTVEQIANFIRDGGSSGITDIIEEPL